jgi:hypothetical protein
LKYSARGTGALGACRTGAGGTKDATALDEGAVVSGGTGAGLGSPAQPARANGSRHMQSSRLLMAPA